VKALDENGSVCLYYLKLNMLVKIKLSNKRKAIEINAVPKEENPFGQFDGELVGSIFLKDPDFGNIKVKHNIVRRLDTGDLCMLHPLWYQISYK
jgi:hypothetical protein